MAASRSVRWATKPGEAGPISAPWSLFTATRYASTEASMMFGREPVPGDDERAGAHIRRAAAADEHPALGVLAARDGLDLVALEHRVPAEDRLDRRRPPPRTAHPPGPFPIAAWARSSSATVSETMPVAFPPCDEVTFQPSRRTACGTSVTRCSTSAWRSASVTSFFASASATAAR